MSIAADTHSGPSGILKRALRLLELLAARPHGMQFFEMAEAVQIPRSATHRLLSSLAEEGYVRQEHDHGAYFLTAKIASLGLMYLSRSGITDLAQPILDRAASECGELVRVAVVDDKQLTFVAKAQGVLTGLRYDPEAGQEAKLSCSSSGLAWLSTMPNEEALALVERQGIGSREEYGPNAPQTDQAILKRVRAARKLGCAVTEQTFSNWMNAMAAPIRSAATGRVTGTVSIAGPHVRLTAARMQELVPFLLNVAQQLGQVTPSPPVPMTRPGDPQPNIFA